VICWRLHEVQSLEVSALVVLLAVLAVVEGLHHLGVLLGGEHLKGLGNFLAVAEVLGEAADLTVDPLDALLGLEDGHVNVLNSLDHVGGRFIISGALLLAGGGCAAYAHLPDAGDEEEQGGGDQQRDQDGGEARVSGGGDAIAVSRLDIAGAGAVVSIAL